MKFKIRNSVSMNEYDIVCDKKIVSKNKNENIQLVNDRLYEIWQKRDENRKGRVTYSFIKDLRFTKESEDFEIKLYAGF